MCNTNTFLHASSFVGESIWNPSMNIYYTAFFQQYTKSSTQQRVNAEKFEDTEENWTFSGREYLTGIIKIIGFVYCLREISLKRY